jgi:calcineurin-like phosphoesterase family protein
MKTFVTSDTHFNHENVIQYCNRPFSSVTEMNEAMIANWNYKVSKNDRVFHLGDVTINSKTKTKHRIRASWLEENIPRLNGEKHLILGNHDIEYIHIYRKLFSSVENYAELDLNGKKYILFHYPMESWNRSFHGSIHFHGHSHGSAKVVENRIDVGVDSHGFFPIEI